MTEPTLDLNIDVDRYNYRQAVISPCGRYRYELIRRWGPGPLCEFIMLNPSKADGTIDDPTIRRCIAFAKAWGYSGIVVRNLYALRSTNPEVLLNYSGDSFGPENADYLGNNIAAITIAAWGAHAAALEWFAAGRRIKRPALHCLAVNAGGSPAHPLYQPATTTPIPWSNAA